MTFTASPRATATRTAGSARLYLGGLEGLTESDRKELAAMLMQMIERGQSVLSDNAVLYEKAMELYLKYRETKWAQADHPVLKAEAERKERERRRDLVTVRLGSLVQKQARTIGPEAVCRSTVGALGIREFLVSRGWSREQVGLALTQIIARAIYPYSELKTVRYLKGNSALLEMFKLDRDRVVRHEDCRHQEIRLQSGWVEIGGARCRALLVDSDAKALKEQSMHALATRRYEEGLEAIKAGISKKGGTKLRDAVNRRLGRP